MYFIRILSFDEFDCLAVFYSTGCIVPQIKELACDRTGGQV